MSGEISLDTGAHLCMEHNMGKTTLDIIFYHIKVVKEKTQVTLRHGAWDLLFQVIRDTFFVIFANKGL